MNRRVLKADLLLLLTACIWGFGFVAQRSGMEYVGPFSFNGLRFILGSLSLLPLILFRRGRAPSRGRGLAGASFLAGSCLFVAVSLQQVGIMFTTAGNAGFITGLYVVMVPLVGRFLGKKTGVPTWIGALCTLLGLYFLSAAGGLDRINPGDIITAISAVFWTFHVLIIDRLVQRVDPIQLSSGQFCVCGLYALLFALTLEPHLTAIAESLSPGITGAGLFAWHSLPEILRSSPDTLVNALIPILYGGLASVGIAYTLQAVAQRDAPPAHATIILCLEGSFAAIGGVLLLGEPLGRWTLLGFALMLGGMIISQTELLHPPVGFNGH
jgi:drug/metabolite transporter (DMT)-like permease